MTRVFGFCRLELRCSGVVLALLLSVFSAAVSASSDYALSSGDTISIHVYGEEDLTLETRLGESGVINYPYLGSIKIKGLTVSQLEQRLIGGLKGDYLINPSVHVSILEYRPFYIYGEVKNPGGYPYQPGLTLERAVALAGGLTERASQDKMTVTRMAGGRESKFKANMSTSIKPDDSILIKDSFF
ncbi:polysaccharide biosynthesis/export family protein [Ferrimonas aestuarii]|uniref:Polysaccharide export protein n=1 Tax=Ferrimonas aestuarii TaxID=2569539 RepID=A0A4U1BMM4_9GAMM|nr:polysaccharide biosynthesis/export family protein [Ferrimonas aestuarii]TKB51977.1 polysaccharide export protein [Ferrimonas aestuarii]